jgi:hypothetical protein
MQRSYPHRPPSRVWRTAIAATAVGLLTAATAWALTGTASAATLSASVSVNASQSLGTFPATEVGANLAVWDSLLADTQTGTLMRNAGVTYLRYPGGSYSDIYHWQTNTADGGAFVAPNTSFDQFMGMTRGAGAQAIVTTNYGSGTPQEAADWVRYANVTKGYGVKYWEVGNEVYGNGHYGSRWENDTHADKSPTAYANNVVQYISAMKAVDSSVKVGVVLTTPGGWPDGVVGSGDSADWNHTVMSIVGSRADFVIFHWYPGGSSEADMLTKGQTLSATVSTLRSVVSQFATNNPPIFMTEVNGGPPRNTQPQALWAADMYLSAAEAGVANADWWNVHNGAGTTSIDSTGATDYGDEGMISNGSGAEPAAQTPFKTYFGLQMVGRVASGGDGLVRATSSQAKVTAHAVKRAGGGLDVLLINKDSANSYTIGLSYTGFTPATGVTVETFGLGASAITSSTSGSATSQTIPPYSLVAVHVKPGSGPTAAPTTPNTSPSPTRTGTPPPSTPPASPPASGACLVSYRPTSWSTGFTTDVSITNGGATPLNGWTLRWSFTGNQAVTSGWNATVTQSGQQVTAVNAAYNATIPANGSATFGFQASYSGTNPSPTAFTLNGTPCGVQ